MPEKGRISAVMPKFVAKTRERPDKDSAFPLSFKERSGREKRTIRNARIKKGNEYVQSFFKIEMPFIHKKALAMPNKTLICVNWSI